MITMLFVTKLETSKYVNWNSSRTVYSVLKKCQCTCLWHRIGHMYYYFFFVNHPIFGLKNKNKEPFVGHKFFSMTLVSSSSLNLAVFFFPIRFSSKNCLPNTFVLTGIFFVFPCNIYYSLNSPTKCGMAKRSYLFNLHILNVLNSWK